MERRKPPTVKTGTKGMKRPLADCIDNYAEACTDDVPELLEELAEETRRVTGNVHWSIGKVEGKLLQMLVKISGAESAVEIGTFTGYSALMIAEALPMEGRLVTCESRPEYADIAKDFFRRSPHGAKIRLSLGPALETLARLADGAFDFVFIDADKPSYKDYYEEALRLLKSGGVIFVDNVLWRGKIFKEKITNENARAIAEFNETVRRDPRVEKVFLDIRDGCYLIRKK
jgi:caffeoyl-CoA O-methyltransferase